MHIDPSIAIFYWPGISRQTSMLRIIDPLWGTPTLTHGPPTQMTTYTKGVSMSRHIICTQYGLVLPSCMIHRSHDNIVHAQQQISCHPSATRNSSRWCLHTETNGIAPRTDMICVLTITRIHNWYHLSTAAKGVCKYGTFCPKHDDVIKWKHFPRDWPFARGIHPPVNSPHKGQWRGALMFSLICVWINPWVNNREAGDLRRYRAHYDVTVMGCICLLAHYAISLS